MIFGRSKQQLLTLRRDQISPDRGELKEEKEDPEEPDDDGLDRHPRQLCVLVTNLQKRKQKKLQKPEANKDDRFQRVPRSRRMLTWDRYVHFALHMGAAPIPKMSAPGMSV